MYPIVSIVLAGGKGTRMAAAERHKVCFEIDGQPAINRALDVYKQCGIERHVVVVGALAGQVIETVGKAHEGVIYAYQAEQRGTGHAARQGARVLSALDYQGAVFIVAGDRLLDAQIVEQMIAEFQATGCDLVFLVGQRGREAELGHLLRGPEGEVLGLVEHKDMLARQALDRIRALAAEGAPAAEGASGASDLAQQARAIMAAAFPVPAKAELAFGDLWRRAASGLDLAAPEVLALVPAERTVFRMSSAGGSQLTITPEQVAASEEVNQSVYLVRAPALYDVLGQLNTDNVQHEEYLSDIVTILAQARENGRPRYRVRGLKVTDPTLVMGFNNPAELLEIENVLRGRRQERAGAGLAIGKTYRPVREWQALIAELAGQTALPPGNPLAGVFLDLYGENRSLIRERVSAYAHLVDVCAGILGADRPIIIARAPGRINIMGRHVDHQGGNCNLMAIDREVLVAAALRDDDQVHLHNVWPDRFGSRQFSIGQLLADLSWDDWLSLVNSDKVHEMVLQSAGDWAQYVRAAVVRLQKHYNKVKLAGLDMVFHGTVPVAAGLSSSSAVVVATAEAIVALNGLDVRPRQFVDLCGEGEWFVGTRGGAADHAAMKFAQRDAVIHVQFFPFVVGEANPFPKGYQLVFCNSHIKAQKAAAARIVFNQRVACYRIGVRLIKRLYPQYAPLIAHLRDINIRNLPLRLIDLYRMLLKLPERATCAELAALLPGDGLAALVGAQPDPAAIYPIRGVVLYGLAECERSRLCPQYLKAGDVAGVGQLMRISHDGDRVASFDRAWRPSPYQGPADNAYLLDLMADLESGEPERVQRAQLHLQPGGYACSMPELDLLVDVALRTEGVLGAQLAGAGLGGGVMVLAHEACISELTQRMAELYYQPRGLEPAVLACIPIAGSGVLTVKEN